MSIDNMQYEIPQRYVGRFINVLENNYSCTLYSLTKIGQIEGVKEDQIREILHFLENRATVEMIDLLEKCNFNSKKMRAIRKSLEIGVPFSEIKKIPWDKMNAQQCSAVYTGYISGFSKEEIDLLVNPILPYEKMVEILEASATLKYEDLKKLANQNLSVDDVVFLREQLEIS